MAPKSKSKPKKKAPPANAQPNAQASAQDDTPQNPPPNAAPPASTSPQSWTSLTPALSPWLLTAISTLGFTKMTPVQASTLPLFLGHKDVVVEAVTGSGKTLSFLIPLIERLLRSPDSSSRRHHIGAIVISPTRELASQIHAVLLSLLAFHAPSAAQDPADHSSAKLTPFLLVGGATTTPAQDLKLFLQQSPNIVIATPGRLNDLLASPYVHCTTDAFDALVLDEADRLLDLGFKDTLTRIIARLPKQRRTGLFSASISDAVVGSLVRTGLRNPVKIAVKVHTAGVAGGKQKEKRTPASLQLTYILATPPERLVHLQHILSPTSGLFPSLPQKTILYLSTCASVDYFTHLLPSLLPGPNAKSGGYSIIPLHGKQPTKLRHSSFTAFTSAASPAILLTTDLAARGLDIPTVDLVLQLDAPTDPKVFLHRCGRAGRAGRRGLAVLFLSPGREEAYIDFLEVRKTPVAPLPGSAAPPASEVAAAVAKMRAVVLRDRALHEKGLRAFVSHVRAYSKHMTGSIFRVEDIKWGEWAEGFALVGMPKMPELRREGVARVELGVEVDMRTYAYRDKTKEAARLAALADADADPASTVNADAPPSTDNADTASKKRKRTTAWSAKTAAADLRESRRAKRGKRREAERQTKMAPEEREKEVEWKELVEEVKRRRAAGAVEKAEVCFEGVELE